MKYDFDVAVIGGGSGGYAAARTASEAGLATAVIEGGSEIGGLCILHGCMPTKALLYAAEVIHHARDTSPWGVHSEKISFDFSRAMLRKNAVIEDFAAYRRSALASGKFKFIRDHARFLDPHTLQLSDGGQLTARHFVIATGSKISPPPLLQLENIDYLTSDEALQLTHLPKSLIILGGGAIGSEFAQFMSRFGVKITLVQRSAHVLHDFDADLAAVMEKVFRREGVALFTGTKLLDARNEHGLKTISFEQHGQTVSVSAEEVLYALGRVPNIDTLGLGQAGVATKHGRIVTNDFMQTSVPHIFAAGDCVGPHDIVHIAVQQGEIAGQNISKPGSRKLNRRLHVGVVFTDPQVAFTGLSEKQARAENISCLAASYPFDDHGKSIIMEQRDGFVKLIADPRSGEILGGACVGPMGGELIHEITIAMAARMTVHEFALIPHYHPTLAEIWTYPAEELAAKIPRH